MTSKQHKRKCAIACGGTGGHIFPGLATAEVLVQRGWEVELWLSGKDVERIATESCAMPIHIVPARGIERHAPARIPGALMSMLKAVLQCRGDMKKAPPDIMLGMGSYATVGPALACRSLKIPIVLHEANVIPGRAINKLSRFASLIAVNFEETQYYMRRRQTAITGMPLRAGFEKQSGQAVTPAGFDTNVFTMLVTGGSRGAHRLNEVVGDAVEALKKRGHNFQLIHVTGTEDCEQIEHRYQQAGIHSCVRAFSSRMSDLYRAADLAVCRAGASTCAELASTGTPALLVPYPYATHDHQMYNARAMEKSGASDVIPERDLTGDWLADYIQERMETPGRLAVMSEAAARRHPGNGAVNLANQIETIAGVFDAADA